MYDFDETTAVTQNKFFKTQRKLYRTNSNSSIKHKDSEVKLINSKRETFNAIRLLSFQFLNVLFQLVDNNRN